LNLRCCFAEKWTFFDNVEVWREATLGSFEERQAKMTNPAIRHTMREIYDKSKQPRIVGDIADFVCRKLHQEELRGKYQDRTVRDIAQAENKHVIDVLLDVSAADDWQTQWLTPAFSANPEYCKEMLSHRTVAGFSDAMVGPTPSSKASASFPRSC
jgi:N-acyl-D-amino-acid deacylase